MNNLLIRSPNKSEARSRSFSDTLFLFRGSDSVPYAKRAPLDLPIPKPESSDAEIVYENESFIISKNDNYIFCSINRKNAPRAVISLFDGNDGAGTLKAVKEYFSLISSVDLSRAYMLSAFSSLEKLISGVADYCGCLTDLNSPEQPAQIIGSGTMRGTPYLAAALPTVCLIYRRLSALRGFNFKLIFPEDLPCLAFSAKIIGKGISAPSDIPECAILSEIDEIGGITVYYRLSEFPMDDGEEISKLTIILSLQTEDPSGILRAPYWKQKTRVSFDMLDINIPGRF